jgi:hypothetical protein
MNKIYLVVLMVVLLGCVSTDDKQNKFLADSNMGLIVLKIENAEKGTFGFVSVVNIDTGKVTKLDESDFKNRANVYQLEPGTYKLDNFQKFLDVIYQFKDVDFSFTVEKEKISYVGDWKFKEYWKNQKLVFVDFTLSNSEDTVKLGKIRFPILFNSLPLKISSE